MTIETSAWGEASFPHLNNPDKEFNSEGIYQVKLLVDFKEAQKDIEIINNIIVEQLKIQNLKHPNKTDKFVESSTTL
jgi:PKD repeat protein